MPSRHDMSLSTNANLVE